MISSTFTSQAMHSVPYFSRCSVGILHICYDVKPCHFLGRIRFLARLRVDTVFTIFEISITLLKKVVIVTIAPKQFVFYLNSTSFRQQIDRQVEGRL